MYKTQNNWQKFRNPSTKNLPLFGFPRLSIPIAAGARIYGILRKHFWAPWLDLAHFMRRSYWEVTHQLRHPVGLKGCVCLLPVPQWAPHGMVRILHQHFSWDTSSRGKEGFIWYSTHTTQTFLSQINNIWNNKNNSIIMMMIMIMIIIIMIIIIII